MESKAKKMFAAVAVIMLCAVAIVGVGYAYTATTTNTTNSTRNTYAILDQTNYTFGIADVQYSTVRSSGDATTYTLANSFGTVTYAYNHTTVGTVQVGNADTLTALGEGSSTGPYAITISSDFTTGVDANQFLILKITNAVDATSIGWAYTTDGETWTLATYDSDLEDEESEKWTAGISLVKDREYTTALYVALGSSTPGTPPSAITSGTITFGYNSAA